MKTVYISGPITDLSTGQPREGWQQDFLDAEAKLRRMGFSVINPVDIAREVEWQWKCIPDSCSIKECSKPTRADYIIACLQRMKMCHMFDRLHGVYVIGKDTRAIVQSHGVQMELLLAEVLELPIYAENRANRRVDPEIEIISYNEALEELLND